MAIILDHTLVPARDKVAAAKFFAEIFGVPYQGLQGPFATVKVNDSLLLDFDDDVEAVASHHYGFLVGDDEFDAILGRLRAASVAHGGDPATGYDGRISHYGDGGRRVYFADPDGHSYEIFTRA